MVPFAGISSSTVLLEAMKASETNHRYLAHNIANADTPGYTPVAMDFQKTLRRQLDGQGGIVLRTARPQHLEYTARPTKFERLAFLSKNDYNKVDLDEQMAKLGENTSNYVMYSRLLRKQFEQTKNMLSSVSR